MSDDTIGLKLGMGFCFLMFLFMLFAIGMAPPNDRAAFVGLAFLFLFLGSILGSIAFTKKKDP
jgi:hypothetical protein